MEVNKIVPPKPADTYDVIGLTTDEAVFLRDLLGTITAGNPASSLYNKLADALGGYANEKWEFQRNSATQGYVTVYTIYPKRRPS